MKPQRNVRYLLMAGVSFTVLTCSYQVARAFTYQFNNGVVLRLDNTLEYSVIERTAPESSYFAESPNVNDGDNNLRAGIVSNKINLTTTFDLSYQGYGFRCFRYKLL